VVPIRVQSSPTLYPVSPEIRREADWFLADLGRIGRAGEYLIRKLSAKRFFFGNLGLSLAEKLPVKYVFSFLK
jgi:hypothetical protein